jgi:hypothetical protein
VPDSIHVEVPMRRVLPTGWSGNVCFPYLLYCGEQLQLTRAAAEAYQDTLEAHISKFVTLRENRKGRLVACPFPYPLLQQIIA